MKKEIRRKLFMKVLYEIKSGNNADYLGKMNIKNTE